MNTFKETITSANVLLGDRKYNEAINLYKEAINKTDIPEQKIDTFNTIGRLYLYLNDEKNAFEYFKKSLDVHNSLDEKKQELLQANKATILNNLGVLIVKDNPKTAMKFHKEALELFKNYDNNNTNQNLDVHIANTHYSYADSAYAKGDYYMAKKQFKEVISAYEKLKDNEISEPIIANAHYNLGNIYLDEDNVYDARNNYVKALKKFRTLTEKQPEAYRSLVAATFNNLAVTAKTMYKYNDAITYYENALKEYEILKDQDKTTFLPFYAATLNSIGIIYAEQHEVKDDYDSFGLTGFSGFGTLSTDNSIDSKVKKDKIDKIRKEKALEYYKKAIDVYNKLVQKEPELYSHYLATAHHNLGVLYDTKSDFKNAEDSFEKALFIRRDLANKHPKEFNLDVCVTLFNIVTMYQNLLEQTVNIGFKDASLKILNEIEKRMKLYSNEKKPIIEGMRSDLEYFKDYFTTINNEYLDLFDAIVKENAVIEEINETSNPEEKLSMQKHVVNLYYTLAEKYPDNPRLKEVLLNSYIKYTWFALRSDKASIAEKAIATGYKINSKSNYLKANEALLCLLKNNIPKFKKLYNEIKDIENEDKKTFKEVLKNDLIVLKRDGVIKEISETLL